MAVRRASNGLPFTPPSVTLLAAVVCHIRRARDCVQEAILAYTGDNSAALFDEGLSKAVADMVLKEILFATDLLRVAASRVPKEARSATRSTARRASRIHEPLFDVLSGAHIPPASLISLITNLKAAAGLALLTASEFAFEDDSSESNSSTSDESYVPVADDTSEASSAGATSLGEPLATQAYPGPALPPSEDLHALDVFSAIDVGQPTRVVQILSKMAGLGVPNPLKDGLSPVKYAVTMAQPDVVAALIQSGADYSSVGWFSRSALSLAAVPSRPASPHDCGMLSYMLAHLERCPENTTAVTNVLIQAVAAQQQSATIALCGFLGMTAHTNPNVPVTVDPSSLAPPALTSGMGPATLDSRSRRGARDRGYERQPTPRNLERAIVTFLRHKAAPCADLDGYVNAEHVASFLVDKGHFSVTADRAKEVVLSAVLRDVTRFQVSNGPHGHTMRALAGHSGGLGIRLEGLSLPVQVAKGAPRNTTLVYLCSREHADTILAEGWNVSRDAHEGLYFEFISPTFASRIRGEGVTLDWASAARAGITIMNRGDDTFYTRGRDGRIHKRLAKGWHEPTPTPPRPSLDDRRVRPRLQS